MTFVLIKEDQANGSSFFAFPGPSKVTIMVVARLQRPNVPVLEVGVDHAVGEALAANTDSFKHTVASQLVHDKVRVDES